jgi:hypothetical protein
MLSRRHILRVVPQKTLSPEISSSLFRIVSIEACKK